mmetsp:Transcript_14813/g.14923  ORF Transcript_14813/g.14923 Transcript_14813/m.14923 type:complete len:473 (+) Transcript_14813:58-1476(+)
MTTENDVLLPSIELQRERNISFSVSLSGYQSSSTTFLIAHTSPLQRLDVTLTFSCFNIWSAPADLTLLLISSSLSPYQHTVTLMGAPDHHDWVMNWPSDWYSGENGTYFASFDVTAFDLAGIGEWTLMLKNDFSLSEPVNYRTSTRLFFAGSLPPPLPPSPSLSDSYIAPYYTDELIRSYVQYNIEIPPTSLGVSLSLSGQGQGVGLGQGLVHDKVHLQSFVATGRLERVSMAITIKDEDISSTPLYVDGTNAVMFAVLITDPRGYTVQIGGHGWFEKENMLYMREWPSVWYATFPSSHVFSATREVHEAQCEGTGKWRAEIAYGFSNVMTARLYQGNITLSFSKQSPYSTSPPTIFLTPPPSPPPLPFSSSVPQNHSFTSIYTASQESESDLKNGTEVTNIILHSAYSSFSVSYSLSIPAMLVGAVGVSIFSLMLITIHRQRQRQRGNQKYFLQYDLAPTTTTGKHLYTKI